MADNFLYIPLLNPVRFYDVDRANLPNYFTKHLDDYPFAERLLNWHEPDQWEQIWQITDIIKLQFESTFDPIIVELVDEDGTAIITLPALVGLPNRYIANTHAYEVSMSLAEVPTGCYRLKITAGTGDGQKTFISGCQYVSATPFTFPNLLFEYSHPRFHEDVMFESGIVFQYRLPGHLQFMIPGRDTESFKDQKRNPTILSSRTFRKQEMVLGDDFGLPDEVIDLLNRIWGCQNVKVDNKYFAAEEGEFELEDVGHPIYPKRFVKIVVEEGINRRSVVHATETDTTKKLVYGIVVEAKVWGDTSNQGSSNTVPVNVIE
jgi:hypothetical protein